MTLRTSLGFAAMAALALVVSGVTTVHAVVQICDVMPERCYYGSDGRWYYTPPPYPVPDFTRAPHSRANRAVRSHGGWGCAYNSSAGVGRVWGGASKEEARIQTMHSCTVRSFKQCRIIGCSANVYSKEDADKLWARTPGVKYTPCGGTGQPRC